MKIVTRKDQETLVIDIIGNMDLYHSLDLKKMVDNLVKQGIDNLAINLDEVENMDSGGIGSLIYINSLCNKNKVKFKIINVKDSVKRVIELSKLLHFLPIVLNEETSN